jgi:FkbM family methyltransferase
MDALSEKIQNIDVAIDVGANIGIVSVWLSKKAKIVHAFEPESENRKYLQRNLVENGATNIVIHDAAVSNFNGVANFNIRKAFGHHSLGGRHITSILQKKEVPVIRIDDFLEENDIECVDVIKLDIEGSELDALEGGKKAIASGRIRMIIFEHAPILLDNSRKSRLSLYRFLTEFGYTVFDLGHHVISEEEMAVLPQGDLYATFQ